MILSCLALFETELLKLQHLSDKTTTCDLTLKKDATTVSEPSSPSASFQHGILSGQHPFNKVPIAQLSECIQH